MDIVIDHQIRDWVFFPIIFVMFMIGVFRTYLSQYMNNKQLPDQMSNQTDYDEFCQNNNGYLSTKGNRPPRDALQMMANGNMMGDMLKNNLSTGVSAMLQFGWVSHFFSGFILGKVPFQLTQKFKGVLQKGVEIKNIDVRYVSSLSLYFLVLFGLSGLQRLILSDDEEEFEPADDLNAMKNMGMPGMAGGGMPSMTGQPPDFKKMFQNEQESIEVVKHKFLLENSDDLLIEKFRIMFGKQKN